jgi:hypothetical protein
VANRCVKRAGSNRARFSSLTLANRYVALADWGMRQGLKLSFLHLYILAWFSAWRLKRLSFLLQYYQRQNIINNRKLFGIIQYYFSDRNKECCVISTDTYSGKPLRRTRFMTKRARFPCLTAANCYVALANHSMVGLLVCLA